MSVVIDPENFHVEPLLVNKIGIFNGAKALGIERAGVYLLDIQADGNWAVNVTQ